MLSIIDFIIIITYLLGMLGLGFHLSKNQTSTSEYFLANRSINWVLIGLSILGTSTSTISYLAFPSEIITNGYGLLLSYLIFPISYVVIAYVILPKYFKIRLFSIFEYLQERFNSNTRLLGVVMFFLMRLSWMSIVIYTASIAVSAILNINIYTTILVLGFIAVIYTSIGGIRADIISDAIQTIILFGGAIVTIIIIWKDMGGFRPIMETIQIEGKLDIPLLSLNKTSILGVLIWGTLINIVIFGADQVMVQRYLCAKNINHARKGILFNLIGTFIVGITLSLIGFSLFAYYSNNINNSMSVINGGLIENANEMFPLFISNFLPVGIAGFVISGLLAAAMSSIDSGINATVNVIYTDISKKYSIKTQFFESMRNIKGLSLFLGLFVTLLALILPSLTGNLIQVASKIAGFFEGPLAGLFLLGMLNKKVTSISAIIATIIGVLTGFFLAYADYLFNVQPISFTWFIPISLMTTIILGLFSIVIPKISLKF